MEKVDEADRRNYEKYYELFCGNSHRGAAYTIKFKNDDSEYVGIPMAGPSVMTGDESLFHFEILEPESKRGARKKLYRMIDYIRKI